MSRPQWPESHNSLSDDPGTIHVEQKQGSAFEIPTNTEAPKVHTISGLYQLVHHSLQPIGTAPIGGGGEVTIQRFHRHYAHGEFCSRSHVGI